MFNYIVLFLLFFCKIVVARCPSGAMIRQNTNFQTVVVQDPYPEYPGINIFNGVRYQNQGICSHTGQLCSRHIDCPNNQVCKRLTQELLFNLIPTNVSTKLNATEVSKAVKTADNILYNDFFYPAPYIPNILCMYNITGLSEEYSCLPKYCKNSNIPCMTTNKQCDCIPEPCQLYYAINITS